MSRCAFRVKKETNPKVAADPCLTLSALEERYYRDNFNVLEPACAEPKTEERGDAAEDLEPLNLEMEEREGSSAEVSELQKTEEGEGDAAEDSEPPNLEMEEREGSSAEVSELQKTEEGEGDAAEDSEPPNLEMEEREGSSAEVSELQKTEEREGDAAEDSEPPNPEMEEREGDAAVVLKPPEIQAIPWRLVSEEEPDVSVASLSREMTVPVVRVLSTSKRRRK
ncbi:UNVERIFIED_CONTAM: hypothetical protein FKN15_019892 [Acipenser sinensis]